MVGLTYSEYVTAIQKIAAIDSTDTDFDIIVPRMIEYAELRIYRELNLLTQITRVSTAQLAANNPSLAIPSTFLIAQEFNVLTPVGQTDPDASTCTRVPLNPVARAFLDFCYPGSAGAGAPQFIAIVSPTLALVGPWPDAAYNVEIVGVSRPALLSATNTSDFISTNLPDLLLAASMIFVAAYKQNWSAVGDDPQAGASYENQYVKLRDAANVEELRKRFQSQAYSSEQPSPLAKPRE